MLEDPDCNPATITPVKKYNTVIVFGEGPLKPVLLDEELTLKQKEAWIMRENDSKRETDFHLMQHPQQLASLVEIVEDKQASNAEKEARIRELRKKWQWIGWYTVKKWGRQNALAAGNLLLHAKTDKVILSGGKTFPKWHKLTDGLLEHWPSEAEMMADIVIQYYGSLYKKKFGRSIEEALHIENKSTNTLENFAYTLRAHPYLLSKKTKVGLLSAGHHLRRISILAERFSMTRDIYATQSAQEIVDTKETLLITEDEKKQCYQHEELFVQALVKPQYLTYWLGYIPLADNPVILQNALNMLKAPEWKESAIKTFEKIGIQFSEYLALNIIALSQQKPSQYSDFSNKLKKLKEPTYRVIPSL